eukprot:g2599.t1
MHTTPKNNAVLTHNRLGHVSINTMLRMKKNGMLDGISEKQIRELENIPCEACLKQTQNKIHSKHNRKSNEQRNAQRIETIGHLHADIAKLPKNADFKALTIFVDEKSRYNFAIFDDHMKPTSAIAIQNIKHIQAKLEKHDHKIHSIRFDKETGYHAQETKDYLLNQTPKIRLDTSRASEQNLAEPKIQVIRERANKLINYSNIPDFLKDWAYRYAIQLTNLIPTDALGGRTPYQEFYNKSPYNIISRIKTFGSIAYYKRPELTKFDKAEPMIFLGISDLYEGHYLLYSTKTKRTLTVHDAHFVETPLPPNWYNNILNDMPLTFLEWKGDNSQITFSKTQETTTENSELQNEILLTPLNNKE